MPASNECPYCNQPMTVTRMTCHGCRVSIDAAFPSPRLTNLPSEHQRFIEIFIMAGGNLKQMAEQAGVSYPTVRSRLDKVIEALRQEIGRARPARGAGVDGTAKSEMSADEAAKIIKSV
jgi:hypothetical protein